MRVLEIAQKLHLKENEYTANRLAGWIEKSNGYADMMVENYGFNEVQSTKEGYRLLFIMNHVCPNLHHFCPKPNWQPKCEEDFKEWVASMDLYTRENSQAGFKDKDGCVVQEGIHYSKEEFDAFIEAIGDLI